jgi:ATP-dependent protease ClpP protease subunit
MNKVLDIFNYSFQNATDDSVDINIDGVIVDASTQQIMKDWWGDDTSVSFKSFRDEISNSKAKTFNIFINSYGGHVGDAMAMHDLLVDMQNNGKTVNTHGRGIIASAATYVLMAGKNAEMSKNSWFMIHNVSGGVYGDVNIVENYARSLRKFNDATRDFYSTSTGIAKENITKMMNAETWMTADEAKEKGFIKSVSGGATFSNEIPKENWHYSNAAVLNIYNHSVKAFKKMSTGAFQNTLKAAQAESFAVVENGFLLTEENLNSIEAHVSDLQEQIVAANLATQNAEANAADLTNEAETLRQANINSAAEIDRLNAEVERLNALTPAPVAIAAPADTFGADPEAKYLTSVDKEMAKQRALINKK